MRLPVVTERTASRLLLGWGVLLTVLLVQRPLFAPDLWWHLARGREVISGTVAPSRELLSLEQAHDADWLSGVPWYLAWLLGGNDALAVVPLLSAGGFLAYLFACVPSHRWLMILLGPFPLILVCLREGWQPVPHWFDLLGLFQLWLVLGSPLSERRRQLLVFLIFAAWGNLGPRPLWGLLLLLVSPPATSLPSPATRTGSRHRKETTIPDPNPDSQQFQSFKLVILALLAGMLTPRGIWTWHDAAILFAPAAAADLSTFGESGWRSGFPWSTPWDAAEWAFLLLSGLWVGRRWLPASWMMGDLSRSSSDQDERGRFFSFRLADGIPLLAALLCRDNLPVCALWIALDLLKQAARPAGTLDVRWNPGQKMCVAALFPLVLTLAFLEACGIGPSPGRRFGWGIAYELTPQLLDARLLSHQEERLVGWAPDGRSVGIVTWLAEGVMLADHPQRALLNGRGVQHAALLRDFVGSHRAKYRRDDGSWGGWLPQLAEWKVEQIFVPVEQQQLTRALLTTTWKPVDLDSPTIPFVSAYDTRFSPFVVEVLQQRSFVEAGPWQPSADMYAGSGWRTDFVDLLGGGPDPAPAILQSQLFRSFDLPMASLRALLPIRESAQTWSLTEEFQACQNALVDQEWSQFGEASEWRQQMVRSWAAGRSPSAARSGLESQPPANATANEVWRPCIEAYRNGQLTEALRLLPRQTPQQRYAAAMLWLELGDSDTAYAELKALAASPSRPGVVIAAKSWCEWLEPFAGRSQGRE